MLSDRGRSSSLLLFPQPKEKAERRREELMMYNRELMSKQSMRSSKRLTSTAPYPYSSSANRFLRSQLDQKSPLLLQFSEKASDTRPFTQSGPKRYDKRSLSPLSIIKTRQQMEGNCNQMHVFRSAKQLKSNFLRKGSSIDRAIISNVLKSKVNNNVCPSAFSYSDVPANQEMIKLIKTQIPKGMKDVVGPEQMMRMSHIMTGVRFKTMSLTHKLNTVLQQRAYLPNRIEDEDNLTLKSIKRW